MTNTNLRYISRAWIEKNGMFDITITPRGGMEFVHESFRRKNQIPHHMVVRDIEDPRKFRSEFRNFLLAHLAKDFEQCTIFYLDSQGHSLGSVSFKQWIFAQGPKDLVARLVLAINEEKSIRLCLPPIGRHVVPKGTVRISFRFEWTGIDMKISKYSFEAEVKRDLRILPKSVPQPMYKQYKKVCSM